MSRRGHDTFQGVTTLTTILPIVAGSQARLAARLEALPTGDASPFASLPRTHYGRFAVLERFGAANRPGSAGIAVAPRLLVSACIDGDADSYARELPGGFGPALDVVFSSCVGYPGGADAATFATWWLDHRIAHAFTWGTRPVTTAPRVRRALALREQLARFVLDSRDLPDAELHRRFRAGFAAGEAGTAGSAGEA